MSCNDDKKTTKNKPLFNSSGNINSVSVIISNEMWKGSVGEAIRGVLTTIVSGLPQDEPSHKINQIPPNVFSGFVTKNRTILKIEMGKTPAMIIAEDVYARPQKVVVIQGQTKEDIINLMNDNSEKILNEFKKEELKEQQRRIHKSLHKNTSIKEKLGLSISFPSAYRIAKEEGNFFWLRKDIRTGDMNIMIYELPFDALKRSDSTVGSIIKLRDSIGKIHIPGAIEGSYMITEEAYAPYLFETIVDNRPTIETKGTWEVKNAFMAGPFIHYAIEDKINNRWVVLEGFTFAPSVAKRNNMFELEAIIKSVKID
jgi:hypothetical protein